MALSPNNSMSKPANMSKLEALGFCNFDYPGKVRAADHDANVPGEDRMCWVRLFNMNQNS